MTYTKVNIDFASYIDVIEFEPFLGEDIDKYQEAFNSWYYEEEPSGFGGTVFKQRSDLKYKIFDVNVIIDWIKEVAPNSNVKILQRELEPGKEDKRLPSMYF